MKYKISISYDGSKYWGLQKLKNKPTIQGELERILTKCNEEPVKVTSSGRTDRGVHALEQICSFTLKKDIDPYKLKGYINRTSSPYLRVNECTSADDDFHARFSAQSKTYKYIINTGPYDPIQEDYIYNYNKPLDIKLMRDCSKYLEGYHDFQAFIIGKHKNYTSTIEKITMEEKDNLITIHIQGTHFYTYMVRNIVKILTLAGSGMITEQNILEMFESKQKTIEYSPAPAGGLYLEKVNY